MFHSCTYIILYFPPEKPVPISSTADLTGHIMESDQGGGAPQPQQLAKLGLSLGQDSWDVSWINDYPLVNQHSYRVVPHS